MANLVLDERVYIGLGSNLDDPVAQILRAMDEIDALTDVCLVARSSLFRSAPLGPQDQPDFINAVVAISTSKSPSSIVQDLQRLERQHLRKREMRWGPRTLDLDILLFGASVIVSKQLQIPHPGLPERAFVLYPLHQVAGDIQIPKFGALTDLMEACDAGDLHELDLRESEQHAE